MTGEPLFTLRAKLRAMRRRKKEVKAVSKSKIEPWRRFYSDQEELEITPVKDQRENENISNSYNIYLRLKNAGFSCIISIRNKVKKPLK
jgi:hypothetical protein